MAIQQLTEVQAIQRTLVHKRVTGGIGLLCVPLLASGVGLTGEIGS